MCVIHKWSALVWLLGTGISLAAYTAPLNLSLNASPSVKSMTVVSDQASASLNSVAIVNNPFDHVSDQRLLTATSEGWSNNTTSGRGLRQIDQLFQQNYWLVGCHAHVPNAAARRLKHLITQIRLNLIIVIREAKKGVASQFGFGAFFKTDDNIPRVVEMFEQIANGDKIKHLKSNQRSSWLRFGKGYPIVGCAFAGEDEINSKAYQACQDPPRYAYQPLGSAWIYLCPNFWKVSKRPSDLYCPGIRDDGSLAEPDNLNLHMSQEAIFVHEVVHTYLGLPFQSEIVERYTIGDVTELSGEQAVDNASNYGYFYSGESGNQTAFID